MLFIWFSFLILVAELVHKICCLVFSINICIRFIAEKQSTIYHKNCCPHHIRIHFKIFFSFFLAFVVVDVYAENDYNWIGIELQHFICKMQSIIKKSKVSIPCWKYNLFMENEFTAFKKNRIISFIYSRKKLLQLNNSFITIYARMTTKWFFFCCQRFFWCAQRSL